MLRGLGGEPLDSQPANAAVPALIRLANAAAQLPYGSGETQGELLLRSQAGCEERSSN